MFENNKTIIIACLIFALSGCGGGGSSDNPKPEGDGNLDNTNIEGEEKINGEENTSGEENTVGEENTSGEENTGGEENPTSDQDSPTLTFFKEGFYDFVAGISPDSAEAKYTQNYLSEDGTLWLKQDYYWDSMSDSWIEDEQATGSENTNPFSSYKLESGSWVQFERPEESNKIRIDDNGELISQPSLVEISVSSSDPIDLANEKIIDHVRIEYSTDGLTPPFSDEAVFSDGSQKSYLQVKFNETKYQLNVSRQCEGAIDSPPVDSGSDSPAVGDEDCKMIADQIAYYDFESKSFRAISSLENLFSDTIHLTELTLLDGSKYIYDVDSAGQIFFYTPDGNQLPLTGEITESVVDGVSLFFLDIPDEYNPTQSDRFYFITKFAGTLVSGTYNLKGEPLPVPAIKYLFNNKAIESIKNQFLPIP